MSTPVDSGKELSVNTMSIIAQVPEDAYKLEIIAYLPSEDKPIKALTTYNLKQLIEARKDYLLLDPDDDLYATYTLTEKGEEEYNKIKQLQE